MRNRRYLVMIAGLLALAIACSACDPTPIPSVPPVEYVAPIQVEGTVHLEGDSVTWNTYYNGGLPHEYTTTSSFTPGSRINYSPWIPEESPYVRISRLIDQGQVDTMVWALGLNELSNGGWTAEYKILWTDLLGQKLPESSCLVIVKPWTIYGGRDPVQLEALRVWIDEFAALHSNVEVVDWKPIVDILPSIMSTDGVHLAEGAGGAALRDDMYREGLSHCAV